MDPRFQVLRKVLGKLYGKVRGFGELYELGPIGIVHVVVHHILKECLTFGVYLDLAY